MTITDRTSSQAEPTKQATKTQESFFSGNVTEIDFSTNTAVLERHVWDDDIRLEFTDDLRDDFRLFAGKYVEVIGDAEYAANEDGGDLVSPLRVKLIQDGTPRNRFLDPDYEPKNFDPSKIRKASWDFDAEEFMRVIKEGRNGLQE